MDEIIPYAHSNDIFEDAKQIILSARKRAYKAADTSLIMQNWLLGKRIAEEVLDSEDRFSTRRVENPFIHPQFSFPNSKFSYIRGFGNKGRC